LYGAGNWALRNEDQKYLESFEIVCWRRKEIISWTDSGRNEVSDRVREASTHDRPLYLAYPDVLSLVELLSGEGWGSSDRI
jgi:hypothetical protein